MPRKRGRKAERGPVGSPTAIKIPVDIKAELKVAAEEQRRSLHWVCVEIFAQWFAFRKKAKKK